MAGKLEEAFRSTNGKSSLRPGICRIWSLANQYRKYLCRKVLTNEEVAKISTLAPQDLLNGFPLLWTFVPCDEKNGYTTWKRWKTPNERWMKSNTGSAGCCRESMRRNRDHLDHSRSDKLLLSPSFSHSEYWVSFLSDQTFVIVIL